MATNYSLTPATRTVTEGNTSITFTVTRSGDMPAETIYASTLFDTASSSSGDYDALVNRAVTFSAGQTSATFTVGINEDTIVEATEHFRVMLGRTTSSGSSTALDISDVYIEDDDAAAPVTYSLTPSSVTRTEGDTTITFTVTRSGGTLGAATVYASTLVDTASSASGDYDALVNSAVVFSSGETSETFTVSINEDSTVEATEHFRVMIGATTSAGSSSALDISDVYIEDDDSAQPASYSLTPASVTRTEGETTITFTVTRSGGTLGAETIYASTLFDTATSSSGDYDALVNAPVVFSSGETSETFTISLNEDSIVEATEHFRVMIGATTSAGSSSALDISDVYIEDNDSTSATVYSLTPASVTQVEGDVSVTFTITRSGSNLIAETLYASTLFDTATSGSGDYDALVNAAVVFTAGQTSKTFTVGINEDSLAEATEHFRVMIANSTSAGSAQALDISDIYIEDDDSQTPGWSLTPGSVTQTENDTSITFTVTRTGSTLPAVTVYASTLFDSATSSGGDYDALVNSPVAFAAGQTVQTFTVGLNEDTLKETIEHFRVMIGATTSAGPADALDISDFYIDDDDGGTDGTAYTITPATVSAAEGTALTFTISRTGDMPAVRLFFSAWQDSASYAEGDYRLANGTVPSDVTIDFASGQSTKTITLDILNDGVSDSGERFRAVLQSSPPSSDASINIAQTAFITITEPVASGGYSLTPSTTAAIEGELVTFTISRAPGMSAATVYFSTLSNGTATYAEGDYVTASGSRPSNVPISFAAGETSKTIALRLLEDNHSDTGEQFQAIVQGDGAQPISTYLAKSVQVTISDAAVPTTEEPASAGPSSNWFVKVAQAAEGTSVNVRGLRYPVTPNGVATEVPDGDDWSISQDLGTRYAPDSLRHPDHLYYHLGEDWNRKIAERPEDSAYAAYGGKIAYANSSHSDFGMVVVIQHELPNGFIFYSLYAHLDAFAEGVYKGAGIYAGQRLGLIGTTPNVAEHLHFEIIAVSSGHSIEEYLANGIDGHFGYTHNSSGTFAIAPGTPTNYYSYSEGGFTWYNPSMFIDRHKDLVVIQNAPQNTSANVAARDGNAVVDFVQSGVSVVTSGLEELRLIGTNFIDKWVVKPLFGTSILDKTVYADGGGGDDHVDGREADRRIVAEGGEGNDQLTGGSSDDSLSGGDGNDVLTGGQGGDLLIGGPDDDSYFVDDPADMIVEGAGEGASDRIFTSISYTLGAGVHVDTLSTTDDSGTDPLTLAGNELDNRIIGNAGANVLYGMGGADLLEGLGGDDSYVVDGLDTVVEAEGQGRDTIFSSETYVLAAGNSIEVLSTLDRAGTQAIDFTGNEFGNALYGNAGVNQLIGLGDDDVLDGGAGADTMTGGTGSDVYIVDNTGDVVIENANEGVDEIDTTLASYSLHDKPNVERLIGVSTTGGQDLRGNSGNNILAAAGGFADRYFLQDGGDDQAYGLDGNDVFVLGGALTSADVVLGGGGTGDVLVLQGDYWGAKAVTLGNVTGIEHINLLSGDNDAFGGASASLWSYDLTVQDSNTAPGANLKINAGTLRPGERFRFDGSSETDGTFYILGGHGVDEIKGGAKEDVFLFAEAGRFGPGDKVDGGGGYDNFVLRGQYTIDFTSADYSGSIRGMESITLASATDRRFGSPLAGEADYDIVAADDMVLAGQVFTWNAGFLASAESFVFDGSDERDGHFRLVGGQGDDEMTGGAGHDLIYGNLGADLLKGNGGADTFRYDKVGESTSTAMDRIEAFTDEDVIDLSRIDADDNTDGNQAFSFIGAEAFTNQAGQLRAYQDPNNVGSWFAEADTDGDGDADLVIHIESPGHPIGAGDFIL